MEYIAKNELFEKPGRAISLDLAEYDNILIQDCKFISTGGIFIQAKIGSKIRIIGNTAENILKTKHMDYAQFVQISGLDGKNLPKQKCIIDCQILGNTITNVAGKCDVEDNINFIAVSGTQKVPLIVDSNTIVGAYPSDLSETSLNKYSGGGIICDRGTCWALCIHNNVQETTNYGMSIAAGENNVMIHNTVTAKNAINVGMCLFNDYTGDPFSNNLVSTRFNTVCWMTPKKPPGRTDFWIQP